MTDCNTSYKKDCYIASVPKASQVKVEICHTHFVRNCDVPELESEEECSQKYDTGKNETP